ncbi:MAG: hypothetical protein ACJ77K_09695 [Bacteroidia bacterium]
MKFIRIVLLCVPLSFTILLSAGCTGRSDRDGNKSLEGSADPANNGGKLSGDHFVKKPEVRDTTATQNRKK